jgi:hypothetical protein
MVWRFEQLVALPESATGCAAFRGCCVQRRLSSAITQQLNDLRMAAHSQHEARRVDIERKSRETYTTLCDGFGSWYRIARLAIL